MGSATHKSKYLNTEQDWSTSTFSEAELARMNQWYVDTHGQENLDLVKFVEFWSELRPEALKTYRRAIETTVGPQGFNSGLGGTSAFAVLHTYTVLAYPQGILYEIISARGRGATKSEVTDVLSIAWLHSGTVGMNTAATAVLDYMRSWDPGESAPGMPFPAGWARDADVFRSGLDFTDMTTITDTELRALEDWHRKVQGTVPAYVPFLARHYPGALKVFRARYESVLTQASLPKQMIAVLFLHTAAFRQRPDAVRRAATTAKAFGVTKGQALHTLANAQRYVGDLFADAVFEPIADLFEDWD
ncbi:MAG TPA: hypothetical protein VFQ42_21150 [Mycobacterium sp.]|nr:hypothetical protein [Mycobacterium sp.]